MHPAALIRLPQKKEKAFPWTSCIKVSLLVLIKLEAWTVDESTLTSLLFKPYYAFGSVLIDYTEIYP